MQSLPLSLLRRLAPLRGLSENSLQSLLEQSECPLTGKGQKLFQAMESARFYFYLLSGEAEVCCATGRAVHTAEHLFPIGYGASDLQFVTALTDCVCLRIERGVLDRQLCWDHVASAIELDLSYRSEKDDEVGWRLTLLRSNLFLKVPPLNITQIFSRLKPMRVNTGDVILRQGDSGDGCYFIRQGRAAVTRRFEDGAERHLADIGYGRCFGEDALIHNTVRNATVTMTSDGLLMRLDKADFMLLLREPTVSHIKAADLASALLAGAMCLDVRLLEEFDVARLHQSLNTPLPCLRLLMTTQLDISKKYIVYCDTGLRSRAAVSLLQEHGFSAQYLLNGLDGLDMQQRAEFLDVVPPLPLVACDAA
jgi:CRP-like cAMP-binding protein